MYTLNLYSDEDQLFFYKNAKMYKNIFDITKNVFQSYWNDLVSQTICFLGVISTDHELDWLPLHVQTSVHLLVQPCEMGIIKIWRPSLQWRNPWQRREVWMVSGSPGLWSQVWYQLSPSTSHMSSLDLGPLSPGWPSGAQVCPEPWPALGPPRGAHTRAGSWVQAHHPGQWRQHGLPQH